MTFICLFSLGFLGEMRFVYAQEDIFEGIKEVTDLNQAVKEVGVISPKCPGCEEKTFDLKVALDQKDKKSVSLGSPHYLKDNEPYVVYIKRTSETPANVDLTFKNGYRECGKMYIEKNPWAPNGSLIMGCLVHVTRYVDEEISLNLKNLPPLRPGEEDFIELKFFKKDITSSKYTIELKHRGENARREEIDKKFFGGGYNVSFKEEDKK